MVELFAPLNTFVQDNLDTFLNVFYFIVGLQLFYTSYRTFKDSSNPARLGTTAFWLILGTIFAFGSFLPPVMSGVLVFSLGLLTLFKQVKMGNVVQVDEHTLNERARQFGGKVFIAVLSLGVSAVIISKLLPASSKIVVGFGAVIATLMILLIVKPKTSEVLNVSDRMVQQVSTPSILPQLLTALGAVFTAAGVGDVIAKIIGSVVPDQNPLFGVIAYVLGMVIFTMIMGNGFAAFAVITAGIGVPFVFALGADPVIASALALTGGFCGTLMTPMAGNFNALPAALLEMDSEYGVIKRQVPVALILIVIHIVLMYFWAF